MQNRTIQAGSLPASRTFSQRADQIRIERAVVGLFFTGVKLNTGVAAACATPLRSIPEAVCCPSSAMAMPFPGKLPRAGGSGAAQGNRSQKRYSPCCRCCDDEALADMCWPRRTPPDLELHTGVDAYDAADIQPDEHVVVVGAFIPFLKSLKRTSAPSPCWKWMPRR